MVKEDRVFVGGPVPNAFHSGRHPNMSDRIVDAAGGAVHELTEASDVHWLNSLNGEACLLVDSYQDLRDGAAIAEVVATTEKRPYTRTGSSPAERIAGALEAVAKGFGRDSVPPRLTQRGFVDRVCDGEPTACRDLIVFLKRFHQDNTEKERRQARSAVYTDQGQAAIGGALRETARAHARIPSRRSVSETPNSIGRKQSRFQSVTASNGQNHQEMHRMRTEINGSTTATAQRTLATQPPARRSEFDHTHHINRTATPTYRWEASPSREEQVEARNGTLRPPLSRRTSDRALEEIVSYSSRDDAERPKAPREKKPPLRASQPQVASLSARAGLGHATDRSNSSGGTSHGPKNRTIRSRERVRKEGTRTKQSPDFRLERSVFSSGSKAAKEPGTGARRRADRRDVLRWMERLGMKVEWALLTPEGAPSHERLSNGELLCELAAAVDYAASGGRGLPLVEVSSCPGHFVLRGTCGSSPPNAAQARHNVRTALQAFKTLGAVRGPWLRAEEAIIEGDHEAVWGLLQDIFVGHGHLRRHRRHLIAKRGLVNRPHRSPPVNDPDRNAASTSRNTTRDRDVFNADAAPSGLKPRTSRQAERLYGSTGKNRCISPTRDVSPSLNKRNTTKAERGMSGARCSSDAAGVVRQDAGGETTPRACSSRNTGRSGGRDRKARTISYGVGGPAEPVLERQGSEDAPLVESSRQTQQKRRERYVPQLERAQQHTRTQKSFMLPVTQTRPPPPPPPSPPPRSSERLSCPQPVKKSPPLPTESMLQSSGLSASADELSQHQIQRNRLSESSEAKHASAANGAAAVESSFAGFSEVLRPPQAHPCEEATLLFDDIAVEWKPVGNCSGGDAPMERVVEPIAALVDHDTTGNSSAKMTIPNTYAVADEAVGDNDHIGATVSIAQSGPIKIQFGERADAAASLTGVKLTNRTSIFSSVGHVPPATSGNDRGFVESKCAIDFTERGSVAPRDAAVITSSGINEESFRRARSTDQTLARGPCSLSEGVARTCTLASVGNVADEETERWVRWDPVGAERGRFQDHKWGEGHVPVRRLTCLASDTGMESSRHGGWPPQRFDGATLRQMESSDRLSDSLDRDALHRVPEGILLKHFNRGLVAASSGTTTLAVDNDLLPRDGKTLHPSAVSWQNIVSIYPTETVPQCVISEVGGERKGKGGGELRTGWGTVVCELLSMGGLALDLASDVLPEDPFRRPAGNDLMPIVVS